MSLERSKIYNLELCVKMTFNPLIQLPGCLPPKYKSNNLLENGSLANELIKQTTSLFRDYPRVAGLFLSLMVTLEVIGQIKN